MNLSADPTTHFRIRSFVGRNSRQTPAQRRAFLTYGSKFLIPAESPISAREKPIHLEVGFGNGQSLLAAAKAHPEIDFIGIETHLPGIGALLIALAQNQLDNVRIINADIVEVLPNIKPGSLSGVQFFFPDPWPKRKHHERRLIQKEFIDALVEKLKIGGSLHVATDWEDYAEHILLTLHKTAALHNLSNQSYSLRSPFRPIISKFEQKALRVGRKIWELQFQKKQLD